MTERTSIEALTDRASGEEIASRMRAIDWASTPLGPVETWSPALRTTLRTMLANRFPHVLWWAPDLTQLYNDPYRPITGAKHPTALGQSARDCWPEIWHVIGPLIETPFRGGPATWDDDLFLEIRRHGFLEETHFTIAYSPVPDDTVPSGIGGVLGTIHEITTNVVGERRLVALRDLGARIGEARTAEEACSLAAGILEQHDRDVPFVLLYLLDRDGARATLAGAAGVEPGSDISPVSIDLGVDPARGWPLLRACREGRVRVDDLSERFARLPPGPWSDPPDTAVVVPIPSNRARAPVGVMVAGISARLRLDSFYADFVDLLRDRVATAIAIAQAHEEERKRAEELAELDRAKTTFFSNVSHELRTPLSLILGPLEDALAETDRPPEARARLEMARRNALRLQKLVNTLLDFSRIEAGRAQAAYEPVDLGLVTADLASLFRSACERAGLSLTVDCPSLPDPVHVDREMWEKVVVNLLSNALKFTFEGDIRISVASRGDAAVLTVEDTGTGIEPHQLAHVFERFYRVEGARGRSHEGSGIGLALVRELAKLHGGTVAVESTWGRGTRFTVTVPFGHAHLPPDQVRAPTDPFGPVREAGPEILLSWSRPPEPTPVASDGSRPLILVADDNADMREYVRRLLVGYDVIEVSNGDAALSVLRDGALGQRVPDLVLADVMMPILDGFGLLARLRDDPRTRGVPVVLLSARAGEERRLEGLEAGATDYLVKPFAARELLARVEGNIELARLRREAERAVGREEALAEAGRRKDQYMAMLAHELRNPLGPIRTAMHLLSRTRDEHTVERVKGTVNRQVAHLSHIVDDLLEMSRASMGKIALRTRRLDVVRVVRQVLEDEAWLFADNGVALVVDLPDTPVWVEGDHTRLTQVVHNLVTNAVKFTDPGGRVDVEVSATDTRVVLTIRDTGVGIEAELLPRLFEPFVQGDSTLDRSRGGLGLGLAMVQALVQLHGGTVRALSDGPGRGTDLVVVLPRIEEEEALRDATPPMPLPVRGLGVLVVEDNRDAAESLQMFLELSGCEVRVAFTGPEGLRLALDWQPDLVLCDIGLPGMSGYEVARRMRIALGARTPRLVALTGYGEDDDRRRALEAGFDRHYTKPVDPAVIASLLI